MSVETIPTDDGEIQDLVLMFANSRIPRGSDAFQTLIEDFLKDHEAQGGSDFGSEVNSDTGDSGKADSVADVQTAPAPAKSSLKPPSAKSSVRIASPRHGAHVHWPDESNARIASTSSKERHHHARLYLKTTPKPILKHDDHDVFVHNVDNT